MPKKRRKPKKRKSERLKPKDLIELIIGAATTIIALIALIHELSK